MIPFYRFLEVGAYSLLNLIPFLLLAIYPFRRHLRFSYAVTNTLIVAMGVVQIFLGFFIAFNPVNLEIMTLLSTLFYGCFYFFVIKDSFGRLFFVLLVFTNLANLVTVCAKFLEGLLFGSIALESYRWSMVVCMVIMHIVITGPVLFYVVKHFTSSVPIQTNSWRYLWVIPATFYLTWYYHLYFSGHDSLLVALELHHSLFLVIINVGAFVVYHTAIQFLFEQKKTAQLAHDNYLLSLSNIQHENLQHRINEARRAKHDVYHHTHLIREYLRDGKIQELEAYLDQFVETLPNPQSIVYCQHYETNSLLVYFAQQAQQHGIDMDVFVQFPEKLNLPETTLSVLLGNLLKNAIEACQEVTEGEKKITVRAKSNHGFIFFDISNNYSGTLKKNAKGEYLSTKKGGQGLGLGSVSKLVNYHKGVFEVDSTENVFRVSVILQEQNLM